MSLLGSQSQPWTEARALLERLGAWPTEDGPVLGTLQLLWGCGAFTCLHKWAYTYVCMYPRREREREREREICNMCVYGYVYVVVYEYVYVDVCICICMHACIYIYIHVYICVYMGIYEYT